MNCPKPVFSIELKFFIKAARIGWLMLGLVLLNSCGFHLRGEVAISPDLSPLHVQDAKIPTNIYPELRYALKHSGVELSGSDSRAYAILELHGEKFNQNVLTVAVGGDVQEFRLTYLVSYSLRDKQGVELVLNDNINLQRDLRFDKNAVLAKSSEADQLRREMVRDAVNQLLRRLQNVGKS